MENNKRQEENVSSVFDNFKDDFRVEDEEKKNMQRQHIIL